MKKLLLIFILCAALPLFGVSAAVKTAAADEPPDTVVFHNCDNIESWNGLGFSNASLERDIKKEGAASVRVDWIHNQTVTRCNLVNPVNASVLTGGELYLEFWLYVLDAAEFNHTLSGSGRAGLQLSSNFDPHHNNYEWDMSETVFEKGWNRVSLKFADAAHTGTGLPNNSQLRTFHFYRMVNSRLTAYFDDIIITTRPRDIAASELGVMSLPDYYKPFIVDETAVEGVPAGGKTLNALTVAAISFAGVSAAVFAGAIVFSVLKGKKKGGAA